MSAIITGRLFWTDFTDLSYKNKKGKDVTVKETTAKIVMLAIGDSADDYGENSWQSFETIAKKSSLQRRSVIRVVRALIEHGYLKIAGTTKYGTNNFSVCMDKLGQPPKKRSKIGRPKIGDSETDIGDSETDIGDSETKNGDGESPDPFSIHPESSNNKGDKKPYDRKRGIEEAKKRKARADAAKARKDALLKKMPLEWKFAHDMEITEGDLITDWQMFENDARDAAHLICQNMADGEPLALAFMLTRGIILSYDKKSQAGHRKALRQMLDAKPRQVKPEHVVQAVRDLKEKGMTFMDLFGVVRTAIDLANPMPGQEKPEPSDRLETL